MNMRMAAAAAISGCLFAKEGVTVLTVAGFVVLEVVVVLTCRRPRDPSLTVQDRCTMNQERLTKGKQPNGGTIAIVMYFKDLPTVEATQAAMKKMLERFPRFSSVVVPSAAVDDASWRKVEVNMAQHVVAEPVIYNADERDRALNELIYTDLPRDLPLWRMDILRAHGCQGCVLLRASHALGDGMRLVAAAAPELLTFGDGTPATLELLARMAANKDSAARTPRGVVGTLRDFVEAVTLDKVRDEDPTCFHAPGALFPREEKRANVTASVALDALITIKSNSPKGTTLNDVLLTCFIGGLHKYAAAVGEPLDGSPLVRALCAVSLPTQKGRSPQEMYNDFLLPSIALPLGPETRAERLDAVRGVMSETKRSRAGFFMAIVLQAVARLGLDDLIGQTQLQVFSKHAFVYSNLPGFTKPVFLFGSARVESFAVYYPNLVSQLLFLSYNGALTCSLSTDPGTITKPQLLVDLFVDEVIAWQKAC